MIELKVLNLNVWGIPFISKDHPKRIQALVDTLKSPSAEWDFVVLEEVWSDRDYRFLSENLKSSYPHSYYFYSGVIGSGVCVFSKGQIVSVLCHRYSLNGYAHKLQHGDWFGGKVAGLCKIVHKGLRVNLYATHIHAEYDRKCDEYLSHRIVQAYELSQFIRCTNAADDDVNIVAGDFNFEPTDLGYDIVCRFAELKDAWSFRHNVDDSVDGNTCNTPDNIYAICEDKSDKIARGKRIDFIMFGNVNGRTNVRCESCQTVLNKIPGYSLCYSDHKGVEAVLRVDSGTETASHGTSTPVLLSTCDDAVDVLDKGLKKVGRDRLFFLAMLGIAFVLLLGTGEADYQSYAITRWSMLAIRVFLVIFMVWCLWTAAIMSRVEHHSLLATKNALLIQRTWEARPVTAEASRTIN